MTFSEIFDAYYTQYRLEAEIPNSEDDEYTIAIRLCNEAIARWAAYDDTYWKELYTSLSLADETTEIVAGTTEYDTPEDFREAGGYIKLLDPTTGSTNAYYPIIEPQDAQFKNDNSRYCFFTGNPSEGYTLHLNPVPTAEANGFLIDYIYYKQPTKVETGDDVVEMSEPYFCVHRMLANRFRGSRNPYYASAKADAEDLLKIMKMSNTSGTWANPWKLQDNSGTSWGEAWGD